jgi:hypothetical protein
MEFTQGNEGTTKKAEYDKATTFDDVKSIEYPDFLINFTESRPITFYGSPGLQYTFMIIDKKQNNNMVWFDTANPFYHAKLFGVNRLAYTLDYGDKQTDPRYQSLNDLKPNEIIISRVPEGSYLYKAEMENAKIDPKHYSNETKDLKRLRLDENVAQNHPGFKSPWIGSTHAEKKLETSLKQLVTERIAKDSDYEFINKNFGNYYGQYMPYINSNNKHTIHASYSLKSPKDDNFDIFLKLTPKEGSGFFDLEYNADEDKIESISVNSQSQQAQ